MANIEEKLFIVCVLGLIYYVSNVTDVIKPRNIKKTVVP